MNNHKPQILVVDDSTKNLQLVSNVLYENGYNVTITTSGIQALESIKSQIPDLILLDVHMPEMDGFEVCRQLKLDDSTKEIPIIFLTAEVDPEKIVYGFNLGAIDYVIKPFNMTELLVRISTHLEIVESRKKLLDLNITKDKLLSIIAHDLKNPFAVILLNAEILEMLIEQNNLEKIKSVANSIIESVQKGNALLENLLEWSRSQIGLIDYNPTHIDLNGIVKNCFELLILSAEKKSIHLINSVPPQTIIFGDLNILSTIVRNLLSNAIKFTSREGKVEISIEKKENEWIISVSDTGIGMSTNTINKLFSLGEKNSRPGTAGEKGTGLGLILCKEFVEKHGGRIWVESEEDKGSCFKFTLPIG